MSFLGLVIAGKTIIGDFETVYIEGEDSGQAARTMLRQEETAISPSLLFPLKTRKYVHLPLNQACESMIYLLRVNLEAQNIRSGENGVPFIKAKIGGQLGVEANIRILPEGSVTALEFSFGYRNLLFNALVVVAAAVGLSVLFNTHFPLTLTCSSLILPLAYKANSAAQKLLAKVNEAIPYLEREYARTALMEERKRWQLEPKDTGSLYQRLREKHLRTWGNTKVLDYKIAEYQGLGLTRNEAIRKTAEEEGIY